MAPPSVVAPLAPVVLPPPASPVIAPDAPGPAPLAPPPPAAVLASPPAGPVENLAANSFDGAGTEGDEPSEPVDPLAQTLLGPVGLLRTSGAQLGPAGSWRLSLRGEYSSSSGFIVDGDENKRLGGNLALSLTPWRYLELFGAILASSNHNQRCSAGPGCPTELNRVDPAYIRAFGDLVAGAKVAGEVAPLLNLGLEMGARLYAGSSGLSFDGDATTLWFTGLSTLDLRRSAAFPVLVHANLGYVADQSQHLDDYEPLGATMLNSRAVAAFAYGVAKPRVRTAIGLEAPIGPARGPLLQPFVEYQMDYVTSDADPAFADYLPPRCGSGSGQKRCSDSKSQHRIGFGLRASLRGGFGLDLGVEIGVGSVGYAYGAPLPPWNFVFGFGYKAGPEPPRRVVMVERVVERPAPVTVGYVGGRIFDARSNGPLAAAIVDVVGGARVRVATDTDGAYVTKGLAPGAVDLEVSAPGFATQVVRAQVARGETTPLDVSLVALAPEPAAAPEASPAPAVPAAPAPAPATPENASVVREGSKLTFRKPLRFAGPPEAPTAELTAESLQALDQAAVLLNQPGVDKIRVEAHWDSGVDKAKAQSLTQEQAEAVARALAARGVAAARIEAVGLGSTRPRVPNLGPQSRARNRRVEITLPGVGKL
jgi:outer membrane protein OmpA-like peptidoglycan-associated protein